MLRRPHLTAYGRTPTGEALVTNPLCERCWGELSPRQRLGYYAELWVEKHDRLKERGEEPDPREWTDIHDAVMFVGS